MLKCINFDKKYQGVKMSQELEAKKQEVVKIFQKSIELLEEEGIQKDVVSVFKNEIEKLEKSELVISVVGTTKAGKSTTINAIVGKKIMPSRTASMTTLPTLITHKLGEKIPSLKIPKVEIFNKLITEILKRKKDTNKLQSEDYKLFSDLEMRRSIKGDVRGFKEIYNELFIINGVMRLAKELNMEPPYEKFVDLHSLPRIEVEFTYLSDHPQNKICFSLLDTPGFDEVGHSKFLRKIFQEQIERSSIVLAIINTRVAQNEVQKEAIEDIQKIKQNNFYILANQFDLHESSDPNYDETKKNHAKHFGCSKDSIYPISSRYALYALYLKNGIKNKEIDENDEIYRDIQKDAKIMESIGWSELQKYHEYYWKNSYFDKFIDNMLKKTYDSGILACLTKAIEKFEENKLVLQNLFKQREKDQNAREEEIKEDIQKIEELKKKISDFKKELQLELKEEKENFTKSYIVDIDKLRGEINNVVGDVIRLGHDGLASQEKQWMDELCKEGQIKIKEEKNSILSIFGSQDSNSKEKPTFQGMITKLVKVSYEKNPIYKNFSDEIEKNIEGLIEKINKKVSEKLNNSLNEVSKRIGGDSFMLDLPQISFEESLEFIFEDEGEKEKVVKSRKREQDGILGSTKRFFGRVLFQDDWGYDEVEYTEEFRVYRKKGVENFIRAFLNSRLDKLKEKLDQCIGNIEERIKEQNEKLEKSLSEYQNNKIKEIEIKQKSSEKELEERKNETRGLIEQRDGLLKRIERVSKK